jgi:Fic family protein
MSAWEKYLHSQQPDALVQLAILHAEFEALHPFLDGNGRLGRMLIPLFLHDRKLLSGPTFYVSAYLEARRDEYYDRLLAVSRDGDWTGWCEFFLQALLSQGIANTEKAQAILSLYKDKKNWVVDQTHSQYAIRALDFIFNRPIFSASEFVAHSGMPQPTANRIINVLRDKGLLSVLREASGRRSSVLAFKELINLTEGRQVF